MSSEQKEEISKEIEDDTNIHRILDIDDTSVNREGLKLEPVAIGTAADAEENRKLVLKDGDFCLFRPRSFEVADLKDVMKIQENLSVVMSSLPTTEEIKLFQIFLTLQIKYWSLKPGCGTVTSFDTGYVDDKGQVYTCLIELDDGKNTKLIICWLLKREEGLELFIPELDEYVQRIKHQLQSMSLSLENNTFDHNLLTLLQSWTQSIMYLKSVILQYQPYLPVLLYSALVKKIKFSGSNEKSISELKLLVKACSVDVLTNSNNSSGELIDLDDRNTVTVTIVSPTELSITPSENITEKSEFAELWAKKLTTKAHEDGDSFQLKGIMNSFKLKIIQDVNAVKRLVRDAEVNYYALYKCYTLLKSTGNIDLLLKGLISDAAHLKETETLAVLYSLREFHSRQTASSNSSNEKTATSSTTDNKPLMTF